MPVRLLVLIYAILFGVSPGADAASVTKSSCDARASEESRFVFPSAGDAVYDDLLSAFITAEITGEDPEDLIALVNAFADKGKDTEKFRNDAEKETAIKYVNRVQAVLDGNDPPLTPALRSDLYLALSRVAGQLGKKLMSADYGKIGLGSLKLAMSTNPSSRPAVLAYAKLVAGFTEKNWGNRMVIQSALDIKIADEVKVALKKTAGMTELDPKIRKALEDF